MNEDTREKKKSLSLLPRMFFTVDRKVPLCLIVPHHVI